MRIVGLLVRHLVNFGRVRWSILGACSHSRAGTADSEKGNIPVPYQGFPDGLYLVMQRSVGKGIDHYGILDIGNRLGVRGC